MTPTPTNTQASQRPQFLFRCRQCPFTTGTASAAQLHWSNLKHPYYAEALPTRVVAQVERQAVPAVVPESPPEETLEQRLQLVSGLLEKLAELAAEVSSAAGEDERTSGTDLPAWMLELSLESEAEKEDLDELLEELRTLAPSRSSSEVAHG